LFAHIGTLGTRLIGRCLTILTTDLIWKLFAFYSDQMVTSAQEKFSGILNASENEWDFKCTLVWVTMMRKKWVLLLVLMTLFLVAFACKKDKKKEEPADSTAPTIVGINLADACTGVSVDSSLYLLFNEAVETTTLTTNTKDSTCSGSLQVSADDFSTCLQMLSDPQPDTDLKGFTITPLSLLGYDLTYKVRVTTGVTDSAGNALENPFLTASGFTTGSDPGFPVYWTKQLGTVRDDYAKGISMDGSGNVYLTGRTLSSFVSDPNRGGWDIFLIKRDNTGAAVWERQLGTNVDDYAEGLMVGGDDNIYVAGKTAGTLESGYAKSSDASSDMVLISYDSTGDVRWIRQLGTSSNDWAFAVAVDSLNNVYLTGKTEGALAGSNQGGSDIFLVKYNSNGEHQWTRQAGTTSDEAAYAIVIDSSDKIHIAGHTEGQFGSLANSGERDIFVMQWNSLGIRQWTHQIGSDQDDYARGVTIDAANNIFVTGYSFGDFVSSNLGSSDVVLFMLDNGGNLVWKKQLGSNKKELGKAVLVDGDGSIFVAGYTAGSMNCKSNRGYNDVLLVKTNSEGIQQWVKQYGSVGLDYGKGLILDSNNELLFAGWTNGNLDGNISKGNNDLLIFKYDRNGNRL
jgi:hypothetical protein